MRNFLTLCFTMFLGALTAGFMPLKPSVDVTFMGKACLVPDYDFEYKTCNNLTVIVDQKSITIPKGFINNLASIPRFLWSIYPPQYTKFVDSAVLHDYLYGCPGTYSRHYIDNIFYAALRKEGVSNITATNMWVAVRLFGESHFNENRNCQ